jgi:hypothetical protein
VNEIGKEFGRLRRRKVRDFVADYKKSTPCADCGNNFEHYIMEFDHVRGKKLFEISRIGSRSIGTVRIEMKKCDLVCANCHRRRTFGKSGVRRPSAKYFRRIK